jgi:general secretion pathway protein J
MTGARHEAGFTLIEMLVSLAILGLAAAMLAGGIGLAGRFSLQTAHRAEAAETTIAAQSILRERLAAMTPLPRLDSGTPIVDAEGNSGVFTFYSTPSVAQAPDSSWRYRLLVSATGDLILFSANALDARLDLDGRGTTGWSATPLLAGVSRMAIGYYGPDPINGGRRWQANWIGQGALPELIRVRLDFPGGDTRRWPDLVVRPRATLSRRCTPDPLTGRCKIAL